MVQAISNKSQITYKKLFHQEPALRVVAPGRINLIGEHTDYSEGFVLPAAINRYVTIVFSPREDDLVSVYSEDFEEYFHINLSNFKKQERSWAEYLQGAAWAFKEEGYQLKGWQGVITGNIPIGAGLSSSAALEIAIGKVFCETSDILMEPTDLALIALKAERDWVGLNVGIMDQLISAGAKESHAMLLDCKTLDFEFIPIPENVSFIVMDTLTRRELTQSEYNTRHEEVQIVTSILGLNSLREANYSDLKAKEKEISPTLMKRANHVINENYRVLNFVEAMRRNNLISMGKLLNESHVSLRDDFEVSSEALNLLVDLANLRPNCYGARMTGAGFGGCALAMVKKGNEESFIQEVTAAYKKITGICPNLFTIQSVNGANSQKLK